MPSSAENKKLEFTGVDLAQLPEVAKAILDAAVHAVKILEAPMGSGKTTLVNAILKAWGSDSAGSSPTFALIEEHQGPEGELFHVDAYRLEHEDEAYDFGFEEYIDSGSPMWIEWAGNVESFLPYRVGVVRIETEPGGTRHVVFEPDCATAEIAWNHE